MKLINYMLLSIILSCLIASIEAGICGGGVICEGEGRFRVQIGTTPPPRQDRRPSPPRFQNRRGFPPSRFQNRRGGH